jgi:hypothetical protein
MKREGGKEGGEGEIVEGAFDEIILCLAYQETIKFHTIPPAVAMFH